MRNLSHGKTLVVAFILSVMPLLSLPFLSTAATGKDSNVRQIVVGLNTTLLNVMQSADALGYQGRYEKLDQPLRSSFDFAFMTKIAVGRPWNDFNDEQRQKLIERFTQMSIATFAARFDGYSGEYFEIVGEKQGRRNTIIVDDQIIRPDDPPVGLNFVLRERKGEAEGAGWRIIDVMLDGKFSELARQRAEFSSVLERGGYEELLVALDERIGALSAGG